MKKTGALLAIIVSAAVLQGCIYVDREGSVSGRPADPTLGQELLDLDRARSKGVISAEEYERLKSRLMSRASER